MFGVADAVRRDLRNALPLHELIRGMRWPKAVKALDERGISHYQVDLIFEAKPHEKRSKHDNMLLNKGYILDHVIDPRGELECYKNLSKRGLIKTIDNRYWLTENGEKLHQNLQACYVPIKVETDRHIRNAEENAKAKHRMIDHQTNIDLGRDGLLETCSKLWWVWNHREAIAAKRQQEFLEEFARGQEEIDKALHGIATAEQRVARQLIEQGPQPAPKNYWTEEDQRAQNDLYWMSGGIAFWLNPHGPLADPVPAPDWWSPPVNYQSATLRHMEQRREDDVVARSLLAPPKREVTKPEWLCLNKNIGIVYGMYAQDEVDHFIWARKFCNEGYTVARRDSTAYAELYSAYVTQSEIVPALPEEVAAKYEQKSKEMILDELIAELDSLGNDVIEDFEEWVELYEYGSSKTTKIRVGNTVPGRISQAKSQRDGDFFMVEFDNVVRGFESRLEAETWLGEQRTFAQQKANKLQAEMKKLKKPAKATK